MTTVQSYIHFLRNTSGRTKASALFVALSVIILLQRSKTVIKAERAITEDVLPDVLPDLVNDITNRRLTKEELAKETARLYEINEEDLKEGKGTKNLLVPFRGRIKKVRDIS